MRVTSTSSAARPSWPATPRRSPLTASSSAVCRPWSTRRYWAPGSPTVSPILRLYRRQDLLDLDLHAVGFDINAEILFGLVRHHKRVTEIPAPLTQRIHGTSNLNYRREMQRHARLVMRMLRWKMGLSWNSISDGPDRASDRTERSAVRRRTTTPKLTADLEDRTRPVRRRTSGRRSATSSPVSTPRPPRLSTRAARTGRSWRKRGSDFRGLTGGDAKSRLTHWSDLERHCPESLCSKVRRPRCRSRTATSIS